MLLTSRLEVYATYACGKGFGYYYGNGYNNYKGSGFSILMAAVGNPAIVSYTLTT